jgi:hypothetical protein
VNIPTDPLCFPGAHVADAGNAPALRGHEGTRSVPHVATAMETPIDGGSVRGVRGNASHAATDRVAERRRAVALARHYGEFEGLTIQQIADRLGRAPATVKAYFYDPTGEKARAVKARYVGVCRGCGAYTQPRNGKGDAYAYCKSCHPGAIERCWIRGRMLDAMRDWRGRYGRLPTSTTGCARMRTSVGEMRSNGESLGLTMSLCLQSARRASLHLCHNLVSLSGVGHNPRPALGIEHRRQPADTVRGVDTHLGIEAHIHLLAGVGLPHKPNFSLRDPGTKSANSRCSAMNEFTNGQNGRTSKPRRRASSSASRMSIDPTPCPSNASSTSVCTNAISPGCVR